MAKEEVKDFTVSEYLQSWRKVAGKDVVCLFGGVACGKSTLVELCKKYIGASQKEYNQPLVFTQKSVYSLEGVINPKPIKPLTLMPVVTEVKYCSEKQPLVVVEVPATIYSPPDKKKPSIDRIVHVGCLLNLAKSVSFVFMIHQKFTRTKPDRWIQNYRTVLDMFSPEALGESQKDMVMAVSLMVTRTTPDLDRTACLHRSESLMKVLDQEKNVPTFEQKKVHSYKKMVDQIRTKEKLVTFNGFAKDSEGDQRGNIEEIFQFLLKQQSSKFELQSTELSPEALWSPEPPKLTQEEVAFVTKSLEGCQQTVQIIADEILTHLFSDSQEKELSEETFSKLKQSMARSLQGNTEPNTEPGEKSKGEVSSQNYFYLDFWLRRPLSKKLLAATADSNSELETPKLKILQRSQIYQKLLQSSLHQSLNISALQQLSQLHAILEVLGALNLLNLSADSPTPSVLLARFEEIAQFCFFIDLILSMKIEFDIDRLIQPNLKAINFDDVEKSLMDDFLKQAFEDGKSKQFYRTLNDSINFLLGRLNLRNFDQITKKKLENSFKQLKGKLAFEILDQSQPQESLIDLFEFLNDQSNEGKGEERVTLWFSQTVIERTAEFLLLSGYFREAASFFRACDYSWRAKSAYEKMLQKAVSSRSLGDCSYEDCQSYQSLLQEMGLWEKLLESCYMLGDIFHDKRQSQNQKIKSIQEHRDSKAREMKTGPRDGSVEIAQQSWTEFGKIVQKLKSQQK